MAAPTYVKPYIPVTFISQPFLHIVPLGGDQLFRRLPAGLVTVLLHAQAVQLTPGVGHPVVEEMKQYPHKPEP
jgi:hypothetical protein